MDHSRGDGELLGRLEPQGDGWAAYDRLGRRLTGTTDLAEAEAALEELGLGYLAGRWELETEDDGVVPVRIVEVGPERVRVKLEDHGAIDGPRREWELPNPVPPTLRPR